MIKIYLYSIIVLYIGNLLIYPFLFGKKKDYTEHNPTEWLLNIVAFTPLVYIIITKLL